MMCHDEPTLLLYVDRELPEAERQAIGSHLGQCARCRALVAALEIEDRVLQGVLNDPWWSTTVPVTEVGAAAAVPLTRTRLVGALTGVVLSLALVRFLVESVGEIGMPTELAWLSPFRSEGLMNWLSSVVVYGAFQADVAASAAASAGRAALLVTAGLAVVMVMGRAAWRTGVVALMFVSALLAAAPSEAIEVRRSDASVTVPADQTVDDTLVAFGEITVIEGTINGDLIAAGRVVRVLGTVKGNVFAFAQTIEIEGAVEGGIFGFGQNVTTRGHATGSLYAFGQSVMVPASGRIDGNVTTFSQSAAIDGQVGRDVTAFGQRLDVQGTVERRVTSYGERVTLLGSARVGGGLTAHVGSRENVRIEPGATLAGTPDIHIREAAPSPYMTVSYYVRLLARMAAAFLTGWLLFWLVPAATAITLDTGPKLVRVVGAGALGAVATPILAVAVGITLVGLPIAIAVFFLWMVVLYLAKIVLAVVVGRALLGSHEHRGRQALLGLAVGLVALLLVVSLPYVGTLANVLFTVTGFGLIVIEVWRWYRAWPKRAGVPA